MISIKNEEADNDWEKGSKTKGQRNELLVL